MRSDWPLGAWLPGTSLARLSSKPITRLRDEVQNLVQEAAPALPADVQGQRLVAGMWQACSSILSLRL